MDQIVDFIKYLAQWSAVEINDLKNVITFREWYWKKNIYFCAGLKEKKSKRCDDKDIWKKSYFFVDIDIRMSWYQQFWEVIDQEKLNSICLDIVFALWDNNLGDFTAMVYSGNGLHLYYTGTPREFDPQTYAKGVEYFYWLVDEIIKPLWVETDHACKNIARITRLPWSINPRKKEQKGEKIWDLWDIECSIWLYEPKISIHFEKLEEYAKEQEKLEEQDKNQFTEMKRKIRLTYKESEDIWKEINSIDIATLAEMVWGVTTWRDNGEIITLKERTKNMGAYVYKPFNIIYNQGSSLIKTDREIFTPYELVCFELYNGDKWQTVKFFKDKFGIETKQKESKLPEKIDYVREWFLYPDEVFDDAFDCAMSWELVTIVAESNSWKTTFAMDMLQRNIKRGKKCFYINLEFWIDQVAIGNWLFMNNKRKRNLTDIEPLTQEEQKSLNEYIKKYLARFDHYNNPAWITLQELVDMLVEKRNQWYKLFVLDTFSRISGNSDDKSYANQNKCMEDLQTVCQNIWICLVMLHHTNKNGVMEWSKKILNLSNTMITMWIATDDTIWEKYTRHTLTKDKFVSTKEVNTQWINRKRVLFDI